MSKMNFNEVVKAIEADDIGKNDVTVPMGWLSMNDEGKIKVGSDEYCHTDYSLSQIFGKVGMPITYEKKLIEKAPELVASQFNFWKQNLADKPVLLRYKEEGARRTLRAFLSDIYSPIDNIDVMNSLSAIFKMDSDLEVEDFYLDDGRCRLRVSFTALARNYGTTKAGLNDIIKVGSDLLNSETGRWSLTNMPLVYRLVCTNGMIRWDKDGDVFRQRHSYVDPLELKARLKEAISRGVRNGDKLMTAFADTRYDDVENPLDVIAELAKKQEYSDKFIDLAKDAWRIEPDHNTFGVINAFTRAAQTVSDERRIEIEQFAGSLIKM